MEVLETIGKHKYKNRTNMEIDWEQRRYEIAKDILTVTSMRLRIYFGGASPNCGAGVRPYLIRRPRLHTRIPRALAVGVCQTRIEYDQRRIQENPVQI